MVMKAGLIKRNQWFSYSLIQYVGYFWGHLTLGGELVDHWLTSGPVMIDMDL